MAYKQQEFISCSSGGWGVQDQSSRICVSRELFFLFIDGPADGCCVLPGQKDRELCGACFIRVLILFLRSLLSWPYHLPRALCSGLGVNIGTWWGEHKHSVCDTWSLVSSASISAVHVHAQLCPTLCDPMDCSPPGSSVHGIFQARILEWVPIAYSGDLPDPGI